MEEHEHGSGVSKGGLGGTGLGGVGPAETEGAAHPDTRLLISLGLNLMITLMQVAGGIIANSLGLLSDAAHNLSDVVALALSLWAVRLGRRPATASHTYAYKRAEILVALFNSTVLVAISVYLIVEAVRRLLDPQPVEGLWVMGFAGAGLAINALSALLLRSHVHDLNLRSAFLHLVGDALTSLAVLLSGLVVYLWRWDYADPIVSVVVSLWISRAAFRIVKSAVNVLMESTPEGLNATDVERAMLAIPGVAGLHDLHVWSISSTDLALSAHLQTEDVALSETGPLLSAVKDMLAREFSIGHATLEVETIDSACAGSTCDLAPEGLEDPRGHPGHRH